MKKQVELTVSESVALELLLTGRIIELRKMINERTSQERKVKIEALIKTAQTIKGKL